MLPPVLTGIGMVDREHHWVANLHKHKENAELVYIVRGSGRVTVDGREFDISEGNLLAYNPGQLHFEDFSFSPCQPQLFHCVFSALEIRSLPPGHILPNGAPPVMDTGELQSNIVDCFQALFSESVDQKLGYEQIIHARLETLILYILRLNIAYFPEDLVTDTRDTNLAVATKGYLDDNYHNNIHLSNIGEAMSISHYHLAHVFSSYFGMSPIQYMIKRRINEAKRMLLDSQLPIKVIASRIGYDSLSNFILQFRKQVGMTPEQFRIINHMVEDENPNEWMLYIH